MFSLIRLFSLEQSIARSRPAPVGGNAAYRYRIRGSALIKEDTKAQEKTSIELFFPLVTPKRYVEKPGYDIIFKKTMAPEIEPFRSLPFLLLPGLIIASAPKTQQRDEIGSLILTL